MRGRMSKSSNYCARAVVYRTPSSSHERAKSKARDLTARSTQARVVLRARIVLLAGEGKQDLFPVRYRRTRGEAITRPTMQTLLA
jgi:hypothetical protein